MPRKILVGNPRNRIVEVVVEVMLVKEVGERKQRRTKFRARRLQEMLHYWKCGLRNVNRSTAELTGELRNHFIAATMSMRVAGPCGAKEDQA